MHDFHTTKLKKKSVRSLVLVALLALLCTRSEFGFANVVGVGTQNFNPVTDGLDYVTVHSSKTLKPGIINLGGFLNLAVNSLPYVDSGVQSRTELNDSLTSSDLSLGFGVLPNVDVGISVPAVLAQSVENRTGVRGDFAATGNTEVRLNSKWRFAGDDNRGFAAVGSVNIQRTKNDPFAGADAGPTLNLELVSDYALNHRTAAALNIGYRRRSPGSPIAGSLIEPMGNQYIASAAVSYMLEETDTKLIGEVFAAVPAQSQGANPTRNHTTAELLAGVKQDVTQQLALHAGAGTELIQGVASPDWRVYAGLNYTFGPVWGKTPAQVEPVPVAPSMPAKYSVGSILFEFDSHRMVSDYKTILAGLVAELRRKPFRMLAIEGHTDSFGSVAYNNDLSRRRAESVRDYLVQGEKFDSAKIETTGYGPSRPIASNGNYQGRQANRRVEFVIER